MTKIKVYSLAEILALERPEGHEREYRRGYQDGWIAAANFIFDAWFLRTKHRIYDIMFDHWEGELKRWAFDRNYNGYLPPMPDNLICIYCGARAGHLDHVIPRKQGGDNSDENLVPACIKCNIAKLDKTPEEWIGVGIEEVRKAAKNRAYIVKHS